MEKMELLSNALALSGLWIAIMLLAILDGVLKAFALWRSARRGQTGWFVCLIVFNTCGILPLIYLLSHSSTPGVAEEK